MKKRIKSVLITFMLLATLLFVTACVSNSYEYDKNDAEGYTVSIRYDANGGLFTTNTSVIVDSYNIAKLTPNAGGKVELALLAPDNAARKETDRFTPTKNGYFLAGWYTERTESTDSNGNAVYTYGNKWDFEKDTLEVDPSKTYTSAEPVLTLYAAWVPMFQVDFVSMTDGQTVGSHSFNPQEGLEMQVPHWSEKTGAMEMYKFPKVNGFTFENAYYDKEGTQKVEGTLVHSGKVNMENATAENPVMKVYVNYTEGEWFHIYNTDQFIKNAKLGGHYILEADLDFTDKIWPTAFVYGNFTGSITGNGHVISNVSVKANNSGRNNAGLFGSLAASARITDVIFDKIDFTLGGMVRLPGASFGVLSGTVAAEAILVNVRLTNSTLIIDSDTIYFNNSDYAIGKVFGTGFESQQVDGSGVVCTVIGDKADKVEILENGNEIVVIFK